jgi:hypothetical protein
MVVILGGKEKKKLGNTPVVSGTTDPLFSMETCILFPSLKEVLTFQVFHHNKIFKNDLLGTAELALDALESSEKGAEVRLKIGSAGELIVLVRVLPVHAGMPLDAQMFYQLRPYSTLRLHLERFVFVPGELVRGNVIFNAGETAKRMDFIHIESHGRTHLDFRAPGSLGLPGRADLATNCFITPLDFIWWSVRATVAGVAPDGKGQKINVVPGVHVWPFEFILPSHLPPSYTRVSFDTSYSILVHAGMADGKVISASKDIAIVPPLAGIEPTLLNSPVLAAVASDLIAPPPIPVTIIWTAPQVALIGIPFSVSFQLQNPTVHNFATLSCHLRTVRIYNMYGESGRGWMANKFIEEIAGLVVQGAQCSSGHMVSASVSMTAQNTPQVQACYPSVPEYVFSDLIQVHHYVELVGITDTGTKFSLGKRAIYVTHSQFYPPFATAADPEPTPTEVAPTVVVSAKATYEQSLQLCIPLGHWVHMDYGLTQGRSAVAVPQLTNTSRVLSHAAFVALNPVKNPQNSALTSKTIPFPVDQPTELHLEHSESFDATQRRNDTSGLSGTVSINQNLGVNLSLPSFGLNDLNRSLFGGGFGK